MRRTVVAMLVGAVLAVAVPTSEALAEEYAKELGLGVAAIGCNLLYGPVKLLYASGGALIGTLGYGFSGGDIQAGHRIWGPSLGGTWVLTPEMMNGRKPILFSGETYERPAER